MKTFALTVLIIAGCNLAHAQDSSRFDGEYKFASAEGTFTYYKPINCDEPKVIGEKTIDARNVECQYEVVQQPAEALCTSKLFVKGFPGVIMHSSHVAPKSPTDGSVILVDDNHKFDDCDTLNTFVCVLIRNTSLHHAREYTKSESSVSNSTKDGLKVDSTSLQRTEQGLTFQQSGTHYWASGKTNPDLKEEFNVKCHYTKVN